MCKIKYVHRRRNSGKFQFRQNVPADLQELLGQKVIKRSLDTMDKRTAGKIAEAYAAENKRLFKRLREDKGKPIDPAVLNYELYRLLDQLQADDQMKRANKAPLHPALAHFPDHLFPKEESARHLTLEEMKLAFYRADYSFIQGHIDAFIKASGFKVEQGSTAYNQIAHGVFETLIKHEAITLKRAEGDVIGASLMQTNLLQPVKQPEVVRTTPRLCEIFESWAKEHARVGGAKRTISDFRTQVFRFIDLHGDLAVHKITPDHVVTFKDEAMRLPKRMSHAERKLSFVQQTTLTDDSSREKISPRTVNDKVLGAVSAVLGHAKDQKIIQFNPASGIKIKHSKRGSLRRLPYSPEDLNKILQFPIFTAGKRPQGGAGEAAVWLPLLAMYTGARLEELGQILVQDVKREQGVWFIDMLNLEDDGKHVHNYKNEGSRRQVPIHKKLIDLGLLEYVERMKSDGSTKVFPYVQSEGESVTGPFSQWWGRYARKHGGFGPQKVFHSFRHSAKDAFRNSGVRTDLRDVLQGHAPVTVADGYGEGFTLKVLKEAMDRLEYDVDLSHLKLVYPQRDAQ